MFIKLLSNKGIFIPLPVLMAMQPLLYTLFPASTAPLLCF